MSDKPNEPMGTCGLPGHWHGDIPILHTKRRTCTVWVPLATPTPPADAPPALAHSAYLTGSPRHDARGAVPCGTNAMTVAPAAPPQDVQDETAWLIERGGLCLGFCDYKFTWVTFTNEDALHFSRERDAYSFKECMKWPPYNLKVLQEAKITSHMWCAPAAERPAPAHVERQVVGAESLNAEDAEKIDAILEGHKTDVFDSFHAADKLNAFFFGGVGYPTGRFSLPAERVSAEELIESLRTCLRQAAQQIHIAGLHEGDFDSCHHLACEGRRAVWKSAALRPTHTPESGEDTSGKS